MVKMESELTLNNISHDRFEANEGKSISDTLGSITKCSFNQAILKHDEGVRSLENVVNLIKSEMKESTKKFNFLVVEEFGFIERDNDRQAEAVPNISKLHAFRIIGKQLVGRPWTCTDCTVQNPCESCQEGNFNVLEMEGDDTESESSSDEIENFYDEDDAGQTDQSGSDDTDSENDDEDSIEPGNIVWGLLGRLWYPARICTLTEVPENIRARFTNTSNKYIAWWYSDGLYSLVSKVEKLGITQLDGKRAAWSSDMQKLYNVALADLSS